MALEIADAYRETTGKELTVINPVYLTGTDDDLLTSLEKDHRTAKPA